MADRTYLKLVKKDGAIIPDVDATIKSTEIIIHDGKLPLEEGDCLCRTLPSGLQDKYLITDRGFNSFPTSHYRAKYVKAFSQTSEETVKNVTYNIGNHSRVNIDSNDSSINISGVTISVKFAEIKDAIKTIPDIDFQSPLLAKLEQLEASVFTKAYRPTYKEFIALAANYMTILGPFIPFLTYLASKIVNYP